MLIGYARVSTGDQTLDLQLDALNSIKCDRIFKDVASGAVTERPGLDRALDHVRSGDTLGVWRLDRLGRSLAHLISVVTALSRRGVIPRKEEVMVTFLKSNKPGRPARRTRTVRSWPALPRLPER